MRDGSCQNDEVLVQGDRTCLKMAAPPNMVRAQQLLQARAATRRLAYRNASLTTAPTYKATVLPVVYTSSGKKQQSLMMMVSRGGSPEISRLCVCGLCRVLCVLWDNDQQTHTAKTLRTGFRFVT